MRVVPRGSENGALLPIMDDVPFAEFAEATRAKLPSDWTWPMALDPARGNSQEDVWNWANERK
jgi:hypothetical protein